MIVIFALCNLLNLLVFPDSDILWCDYIYQLGWWLIPLSSFLSACPYLWWRTISLYICTKKTNYYYFCRCSLAQYLELVPSKRWFQSLQVKVRSGTCCVGDSRSPAVPQQLGKALKLFESSHMRNPRNSSRRNGVPSHLSVCAFHFFNSLVQETDEGFPKLTSTLEITHLGIITWTYLLDCGSFGSIWLIIWYW